MSKKIFSRNFLLTILKIIIGVTIFYLIIKDVDIIELKESFQKGTARFLLLGISVITFAQVFIQTFRFHYIIRRLKLTYSFSLDLSLIGLLFNNLLPTAIGGDIARTLLLRDKTNISYTESITYVAVHRASGLLSLLAMFCLFLLFKFDRVLLVLKDLGIKLEASISIYILILGLLALLILAFFRSRFKDFINKGLETLAGFSIQEIVIILLLGASYHLTTMLGFFTLVHFFNENIDFQSLIIVQAFTAVVAMIPISIGALGLMEGTIIGMFIFFGLSKASATGIALIIRLLLIIYALCGLLIVLLNKKYQKISLMNK